MLDKYISIGYISSMFDYISNEKLSKKINFEIGIPIIEKFLSQTMIFISIYGLKDIKDKVIYCINFIIDNDYMNHSLKIQNQLYELIKCCNAYPLLAKLELSDINKLNYVDYLSLNVRKYGKYYYNDKQISIYNNIYLRNNDIIFTAPTSYGKTHLTIMSILDMMKDNLIKNVLIIVPIKAMINDYRKTISKLITDNEINVFESPYIKKIDSNSKNIFIYTQERTLVASSYNGFDNFIDIVVIDEAQSLANVLNDRTLLLIKALSLFTNVQKIYLAPFVKNMYGNVIEKLISSSKTPYLLTIDSSDAIVSNNKYIVDITKPGQISWYDATFAKNESELIKIKDFNAKQYYFQSDYSEAVSIILSGFDEFINRNEKSIIYIASKVESMNVALRIYNMSLDKDTNEMSPRIKALINHLENNIHNKFLMISFIKRGVAYHNAYLDNYTKRQLEYIIGSNNIMDSFIDKLVCTNTIDSGVNLNAKNIFVLIKSRIEGSNQEIRYANLLGRAARISNNTQGNLFYIKISNGKKYEREFYKSNQLKEIITDSVNLGDVTKAENTTYKSFLEDKNLNNIFKEQFLKRNNFEQKGNILTSGEVTLNVRDSNGLDYYIDYKTIIESEEKIRKLSADDLNIYLKCLGNYDDTKKFLEFLKYCYDWEHNLPYKIKKAMTNSSLIATLITYMVQGRSIKEIVDSRIKSVEKRDCKLLVNLDKNFVMQVEYFDDKEYDGYEVFDKNNDNHINVLIINSLEQTQTLIEFYVKKYIQDFYLKVRNIFGELYSNDDIGNFLEFSSIDNKKIFLIENGIIDSFALNEFVKEEYNKFYVDKKIKFTEMIDYVKNKFGEDSPFYYSILDIK